MDDNSAQILKALEGLRNEIGEIRIEMRGNNSDSRTDMNTMRTDLNELRMDMNEFRTDLNELHTDMNTLGTDMNTLGTGMNKLGTDMNELRTGMNELRTDMDEFHGEMNEFRVDMDEFRSNTNESLKGLRRDVTELKVGQVRVESKIDKLNTNIITSMGDYTDKIVNHFDDTTQVLNNRIFKVETAIEGKNRK